MSRSLVCWVMTVLLLYVNRVFYVVMVHMCNLSRWQPVGLWPVACWWTSIAPAESCKPPVRPAALDTSPTRMQPKTRHICHQHWSSANGKRYFLIAGYGSQGTKPERRTLGRAYSTRTYVFNTRKFHALPWLPSPSQMCLVARAPPLPR